MWHREKHSCHFEQSEKSASVLHSNKADFSPDEAGFEMTMWGAGGVHAVATAMFQIEKTHDPRTHGVFTKKRRQRTVANP